MANNSTDNVSVTKGVAGGYFFVAPAGTTLPTDCTTALGSSFTNVGYISDEGISHSKSASSTDFHDMNGDTVANAVTEITRTMTQRFIEINATSLAEYFGATNVTNTNDVITVKDNNTAMPERVIVLELVLKDGRKWRRVVPRAKVTDWSDQTDVSTELAGLECTYTKYADASGNYEYDYIQVSAASND